MTFLAPSIVSVFFSITCARAVIATVSRDTNAAILLILDLIGSSSCDMSVRLQVVERCGKPRVGGDEQSEVCRTSPPCDASYIFSSGVILMRTTRRSC